jgi:hypothetical protein
LLTRRGTALVEVSPPGSASRRVAVRLLRAGEVSASFPWATLSATDAASVAGAAGFSLVARWRLGRRWFVELGAC